MFTNTKIALAAALIFGSASTALANDSGENHQDNDRSAVSSRAAPSKAGSAFGYAAPVQKHSPGREHDYSDRIDDNR
jgi:hypothetical protein